MQHTTLDYPVVRLETPAGGVNDLGKNKWNNNYGLIEDKIRQVNFVDYHPKNVVVTVEPDIEFVPSFRELTPSVVKRGPDVIVLELIGVAERAALPSLSTRCDVYIRMGYEITPYKMQVMYWRYDKYTEILTLTGYDATVPPPQPKPCEECEKRRRRKNEKKRLKEGSKQFGRKFASIAELEDYEDGYYAALDW